MKKIFIYILTIILVMIFNLMLNIQDNRYKVFKIISPTEFYVDTNKNLIFDETEPIKINNLYYQKDFRNNILLKDDFTNEEIFFIKYFQNKIVKRLLQNKFVQIRDNEVYVGNKKYNDVLLDSHLFFDDSIQSQENYLRKIKSYNLDEFYILNSKSKRYHKLSCDKGRSSKEYEILHKNHVKDIYIPCGYCLPKEKIKDFKYYTKKVVRYFGDEFNKDNINIYFIDLNRIYKPSLTCDTKACKSLLYEIQQAKNSIDFAVYGINNQPEIYNALVAAYNRGVKVRWVLDYDKSTQTYYADSLKLQKNIPSFNWDKESDNLYGAAIMHNKFFIFDNQKVWTGTANITGTDFTGFNANYGVLINSKEIADIYLKEFNQMYGGLFHKQKNKIDTQLIKLSDNTKVKVLFSPKDNIIPQHIVPIIEKAKKYIYVPIFYITNKDIKNALISASKKGVDIKIINDSTNAHARYSIHKELRTNGIAVKTENFAGKMHMKTLIIDDEISIIGSMNFTKSGNNKNDENVLIIYDKDITEYLKKTFLYLWKKIPDTYLEFDPYAESKYSIGACSDGIDNDFDGKIDSADDGCKY